MVVLQSYVHLQVMMPCISDVGWGFGLPNRGTGVQRGTCMMRCDSSPTGQIEIQDLLDRLSGLSGERRWITSSLLAVQFVFLQSD